MRPLFALLAFLFFSLTMCGANPIDVHVNAPEDTDVRYSVEKTGDHTYQLDINWD